MAAQSQAQAKSKVNGAAQAAARNGHHIPHVETESAPQIDIGDTGAAFTEASSAALHDAMGMMGFKVPSWKQVAFSFVAFIALSVGAYVAAPVVAGILAAGVATVTVNGFALWLASALGYLVTLWASYKTLKGVNKVAGWVSGFVAGMGAAPVAA